jgi:glycosyltransferase involved in cell wall biosynthesis
MVRISVCMTSYNGELYIKPQIDSILSQLSDEDELIISDDGSQDNTINIIKSYNDSRIRLYINNFKNHILNFEFVLSKAKGNYIFLADQDDVWVSNKVNICLNYLKKYDLICSDCFVVDGNMEIIKLHFHNNSVKQHSGFIKNIIKNNYLGCCLAFNRKILEYSLPFPNKLITHDTWIGLVAELVGKTLFITDRLIYFRRHSSNTSNTLKKSNLSLSKRIHYRVIILRGLVHNIILRKHF